MAVIGIGIDLSDVRRIKRVIEGPHGDRFVRRVYTEKERRLCAERFRPEECFAARFAAKEAYVKAMSAPRGLRWHEVEVTKDGGGQPTLSLSGRALELSKRRGVARVHLSLTHDGDMAAAVVVLESEGV